MWVEVLSKPVSHKVNREKCLVFALALAEFPPWQNGLCSPLLMRQKLDGESILIVLGKRQVLYEWRLSNEEKGKKYKDPRKLWQPIRLSEQRDRSDSLLSSTTSKASKSEHLVSQKPEMKSEPRVYRRRRLECRRRWLPDGLSLERSRRVPRLLLVGPLSSRTRRGD